MDAVAERRTLMVGSGVLVLAALWSMAVPRFDAPTRRSEAPVAPQPTQRGSDTLSTRPEDAAAVRRFVTACRTAAVEDIPRLRELALGPDLLVAGNAIAALGRLGAVHEDPELMALLHDSAPRVRHELILALGECGDPTLGLVLEPILHDPDRQARALAIVALGKLGVHAPLQRLCQDTRADEVERGLARAALRPAVVPAVLAKTGGSGPW